MAAQVVGAASCRTVLLFQRCRLGQAGQSTVGVYIGGSSQAHFRLWSFRRVICTGVCASRCDVIWGGVTLPWAPPRQAACRPAMACSRPRIGRKPRARSCHVAPSSWRRAVIPRATVRVHARARLPSRAWFPRLHQATGPNHVLCGAHSVPLVTLLQASMSAWLAARAPGRPGNSLWRVCQPSQPAELIWVGDKRPELRTDHQATTSGATLLENVVRV